MFRGSEVLYHWDREHRLEQNNREAVANRDTPTRKTCLHAEETILYMVCDGEGCWFDYHKNNYLDNLVITDIKYLYDLDTLYCPNTYLLLDFCPLICVEWSGVYLLQKQISSETINTPLPDSNKEVHLVLDKKS